MDIHAANFRIEEFDRSRNYLVVPPQDLHVTLYQVQVIESLSRGQIKGLPVGVVQATDLAICKVVRIAK